MKLERLYTTKEAADLLKTYPRLLLNISDMYKIPYHVAGKGTYRLFNLAAIERMRPYVVNWQNRAHLGDKRVTA